jgi:hypothetical protein
MMTRSLNSRRPVMAALATALAAVMVLGGCSAGPGPSSASSAAPSGKSAPETNPPGDIPDNQAFVSYSPSGGGYTVEVPEGWQRSQLPGGATFTDKLNSVTVQQRSVPAAPTVASVRAGNGPSATAPTSAYRDGQVQQVQLPAGTAVQATYTADGPVDPVTGKAATDDVVVYTLYRSGQEAELVLAGPHGADNVDPWRTVSESFAWTP